VHDDSQYRRRTRRDPQQPPAPAGPATARIRAIGGEKDSPVFNQTLLKRFVNLDPVKFM